MIWFLVGGYLIGAGIHSMGCCGQVTQQWKRHYAETVQRMERDRPGPKVCTFEPDAEDILVQVCRPR